MSTLHKWHARLHCTERRISAGHDISDGGLITAALEMAFAGNCGVNINLEFDQEGTKHLKTTCICGCRNIENL